MERRAFDEAVVHLLWGLWQPMGVPGVVPGCSRLLLDVEPLLLLTAWCAGRDARLDEEVVRWCGTHGGMVSKSRLKGLVLTCDPAWRDRFRQFGEAIGRTWGPTRWLPDGPRSIGPGRKLEPAADVPVSRPNAIRFRNRLLCGVGARADVLTEILYAGRVWSAAADFLTLGYGKRIIGKVLGDLVEAGLLEAKTRRNRRLFRVVNRESLCAVMGAEPLQVLDLMAFGRLLVAMDRHWPDHRAQPVVQRIEAVKSLGVLAEAAKGLDCILAVPDGQAADPPRILSDWLSQTASSWSESLPAHLVDPRHFAAPQAGGR